MSGIVKEQHVSGLLTIMQGVHYLVNATRLDDFVHAAETGATCIYKKYINTLETFRWQYMSKQSVISVKEEAVLVRELKSLNSMM